MSNLGRVWIFFGIFLLALFFGDAIITKLFPNLSDFWQTLAKLFVITIIVCVSFIFSRRTPNTASNTISEIGQTPITLFLGIYIVAALLLGAYIQINFFPEIANLPGIVGDIVYVAIGLAYLGIVWVLYKIIKR